MSATDVLDKSFNHGRDVATKSYNTAMTKADGGMMVDSLSPTGASLNDWQQNAKYNQRYALFRGWLYAAIDAIGHKAASQPVKLGRVKGRTKTKKKPPNKKDFQHLVSLSLKSSMTSHMASKAAEQELEVIEDHELLTAFEQPNFMQGRWQFTYMFVANLALTGWGYVVRDEDEDGNVNFYALPSTWVTPVHKQGPFSQFRVKDPNKPSTGGDDELLDGNQVAFAYLPNPANPRTAFAPTTAQLESIKINDYIQSSRQSFFERGVFPSVIVSIGRNPHPDVPGGVRPRLSPNQRRQVNSMIRKTMSGVANYGNPAIVDGLIESVERLSMTDNEMGWDKSEQSVKTAILSTYCVHPYILGEAVSVGGYAQVRNIEKRFFERVNSYLDMISIVMTKLVKAVTEDDSLLVWWQKCDALDPSQENTLLLAGRRNGDVTQNEFRARLGLPPDVDNNESVISQQLASHVKEMLVRVASGAVPNDQAMAYFEGLGLPSDLAKKLAGPKVPKQAQPPQLPGPGGGAPPVPEGEEVPPEKALLLAVEELRNTDLGYGRRIAKMVVGHIKGLGV